MEKANFNDIGTLKDEFSGFLAEYSMLLGDKQANNKLETIGNDVAGLGLINSSENCKQLSDDISKGIFKVLVVGSFKNGKSTVLNALNGIKSVPVGITATTSIITILINGKQNDTVTVFFEDSTREVLSTEDFYKKYRITPKDQVQLNKEKKIDRFAHIDYAQIEVDNYLCRNGVKLIDSPGLGESISRTKTTMRYLPSANSLLMVLKADKLFDLDERKFILENLANKQRNNAFFLVNFINVAEQQGPEAVEEVKESVRMNLHEVFVDKEGEFDEELFNRRVFYINAFGAFKGRVENDEEQLKQSGLLAFEDELTKFLTSDDRTEATFASTINTMSQYLAVADSRVQEIKATYSESVAELEERKKEAEKILDSLKTEKNQVLKAYSNTKSIITSKVMADLNRYINVLEESWEEDSSVIEIEFGLGNMLKMAGNAINVFKSKEERMERMQMHIEPISDAINQYFLDKFNAWGDNVDGIIGKDLESLNKEVNVNINSADIKITRAANIFFNGSDNDVNYNKAPNLIQLALSAVQGDISVLVENAAGGGMTWGTYLKKYIVQAVIQIIIFTLIGGPVGILAFIGYELYQMIVGAAKMKDGILAKMKNKMFLTIRTALDSNYPEFEAKISETFDGECKNIITTMDKVISEQQKAIGDIISERSNKDFSFDKESKRMDKNLRRMGDIFIDSYEKVYNEKLSYNRAVELGITEQQK